MSRGLSDELRSELNALADRGLARKLEPFGITLGQDQIDLAYVIEEVGELGIPLMFAVAIYLTYRLPRLAAAAPSTAP